MMYGRTRLSMVVKALLLVGSFFVEGIQAAIEGPEAIRQASSNSTQPAFFFGNLPQPNSCGSSTFTWTYDGPPDDLLTLQVINYAPTTLVTPLPTTASHSSPTIINRSIPSAPASPINEVVTIATNLTPSSLSFIWNPVNVPQGVYVMLAIIPAAQSTPSSPFFVRMGSNTSCLVTTGSSTTSSTVAPSSTIASQSTDVSSSLSSSSAARIGTIVGVTLGIAAIVIAALIGWFCIYRKSKSHPKKKGRARYFGHHWNGLNSTDSQTGFTAQATNKNYRPSRSYHNSHVDSVANSVGPDFDDVGLGVEKGKDAAFFDVALSTLPVLHHHSRRYSGSSSNSNCNGKLDNGKPSIDSPVSPRDSAPYLVSHSRSTTHDPSSQEAKQMNRQSLGRKRKPVPTYDPDTELASPTTPISPTLATSFSGTAAVPELSHKGSFGPGGIEGRPLHYLIPDMPM